MQLFKQDYIQFQNLKIAIHLGVHAWEKQIQQQVMVDLKLFLSLQDCQDELKNSVCYAKVSEDLRQLLATQHYELIETVTQNIAEYCLKNYPLDAIEVIVKKFHMVDDCQHVATRMLRFADHHQ